MTKNWRTLLAALLLANMMVPASAEEGVTDNTILIGQTTGVTGPFPELIKEMIDGANAYISDVNKHGGIHGRKIVMRIRDDKGDAKTTAIAAEKLIKEDHVFALFQNRGTPHTEVILPIMAANGVPLVAPSTGAAIFHKPVNRLLFNVRAKYQNEVIRGVEHFTTVGVTAIGMLHVDDSFGRDALEGFNKAMAERKLVPYIVAKFDRVKADVDGTVAALMRANPKAVIIVSPPQHIVPLIKAIRATGSQMQIMTLSNTSSQALVKDLGPAGVGVIVSQITPPPHLISSGLGQEFKNLTMGLGVAPSYAAMEGFVSAKVLVEGLRRAGRNLTRESFIRGLESMQKVDLGGLMVTYGPDDHTGSEFVELTMINKDGRFIR
jgi:branched-chain amino acid transport system substrate-binding protein